MAALIWSASYDECHHAIFLDTDSVRVKIDGYGDNCRVEDFRMSHAEFASKLEEIGNYTISQHDFLRCLSIISCGA